MAKAKSAKPDENGAPIAHGSEQLPSVTVDNYNLELRDKDGFVGDKAKKSVFTEKLEDWRKRVRTGGIDPLGDVATKDMSRKQIDAFLKGDDKEAVALVMGAIGDFAGNLADVLARFLKDDGWKGTERIVVGGGFKESKLGHLAIAKAMVILKADGFKIELQPIVHHPDDAGLIGSAHLMPSWMLKGHEAIIAVDIGGTNIRAGIVQLNLKDKEDLSKAKVWKSDIWRHADDAPSRSATVERLVAMIEKLIRKAEKAGLVPAPMIGVACPGIIQTDGAIARGGQNLPGGNWESEHFNLPKVLAEAIPRIDGQQTFVIMHNDAVVQGLSQIPFMQDITRWGVVTIGTGLGNARFTNRSPDGKKKS